MLLAFNLTEKKLTMSFDFVTTYSFHLKISHSVPYLDHKKCNDLISNMKKIVQEFHFQVI